jgi:hypothetical protein
VDDYFLPMAERVFGEAKLEEPERNAKAIARRITSGELSMEKCDGRFVTNLRKVRQQHINQITTNEVAQAFEELVELGWLMKIQERKYWAGATAQGRCDQSTGVSGEIITQIVQILFGVTHKYRRTYIQKTGVTPVEWTAEGLRLSLVSSDSFRS